MTNENGKERDNTMTRLLFIVSAVIGCFAGITIDNITTVIAYWIA